MLVKILTLENGLEVINDVKLIRIKSDNYNLLIMKDYLSIIGQINGMIEIETLSETIKKENITAYYINNDNEFKLIIKEVLWIK